MGAFLRGWTVVFAALTALLSLAVLYLVRENGHLRERMEVLAASKARAAGLEPGKALAPFVLRDAAGRDVRVDFAGGFVGTLVLIHASACDACAHTRPAWRDAVVRAARPDVRVVCVQTDASEAAPLAFEGLPESLAVPLPPVGWLAAIPAVPATLVLDENGVLQRAWYGEFDGDEAAELAGALGRLGAR